MSEFKGKMHESAVKFPMTDIWMDSCGEDELNFGLERGIVGATSNPVIAGVVVRQELAIWEKRIIELIDEMPTATEEDIAWKLLYEISALRSKKLMPIFEEHKGLKGRLSLQTNIKNYRNTEKMVEQGMEIHNLSPNMQVKMPASAAGIAAMEEVTYRGGSINATVSFTVSQAVAVAEAVERGLKRREAEGLPVDDMAPVCTLMIGRVDDWLKAVTVKEGLCTSPEALEWAGTAVIKRSYEIYKERGYRTRLLSAANRNLYHWSELVGGDLAQTINIGWYKRYNNCGIDVVDRMSNPVPQKYLDELSTMKEFHRSYDEDGMTPDEFVHYGGFIVTLNQFLEGADDLYQLVRGYMVK